MKKFYCKQCNEFYYSSSAQNNKCDVCSTIMKEVEIGNMSISEEDKNRINEKWDKLKGK